MRTKYQEPATEGPYICYNENDGDDVVDQNFTCAAAIPIPTPPNVEAFSFTRWPSISRQEVRYKVGTVSSQVSCPTAPGRGPQQDIGIELFKVTYQSRYESTPQQCN